ncbi:hypothetical protein EON68_02715, partial [archaeon]
LGSLDEASARFLMAEVVAAMAHIHAKGFVYGDCKPENIVLVEAADGGGHAKLTDFGACRPMNDAARAVVAGSRDIVTNLRSGEWRDAAGIAAADAGAPPAAEEEEEEGGPRVDSSSAGAAVATDTELSAAALLGTSTTGGGTAGEEEGEDERCEGTMEYMAPELQQRVALPSISSDAFALGITIYQLLSGQLLDVSRLYPELASAAHAWRSSGTHHVGWRRDEDEGPVFGEGFPTVAADLVTRLVHPDPAKRLGGGARGFEEIMEHAWFTPLCATRAAFEELHKAAAPRLAVGVAAPSADPSWSRRHNSTMWAPLPQAYLPSAGAATASAASGGAARGATGRVPAAVSLSDALRAPELPPLSPVSMAPSSGASPLFA